MANAQGKGRGGKKNFPCAQTVEPDERLPHVLKCLMYGYSQPRVRNDEELEQRLAQFFMFCADNNIPPTIEAMYQFTGYSPSYMADIRNGHRKGFSPETAQILKKAQGFMQTFDAQMVIEGKMNPVTYIFRAKNYYGMTDQQQITVAPQATMAIEGMTDEELGQRLLEATGKPSDYDPK